MKIRIEQLRDYLKTQAPHQAMEETLCRVQVALEDGRENWVLANSLLWGIADDPAIQMAALTSKKPLTLTEAAQLKPARALLQLLHHCQQVLANHTNYNLINLEAWELCQRAYQQLLEPLETIQAHMAPLKTWIQQLHQAGFPTLKATLLQLQQSFTICRTVRQELLAKKDQVIAVLHKIEYGQAFASEYKDLCVALQPFIAQLETNSLDIDYCIRKLQDSCLLLLTQQPTHPLTPQELAQQFHLLNNHLSQTLRPLFDFFDAFSVLVMSERETAHNHADGKLINWQDSYGHKRLMTLFLTDVKEIDLFLTQVAEQQQLSVEHPFTIETVNEADADLAEELVAVPDSVHQAQPLFAVEVPTARCVAEQRLHAIGQQTNPRRLLKDLKQFFKEYDQLVAFLPGKGSHQKLYVHGIPVPLPMHATLKRGTAHAITQEIFQHLERWI